MEVSQTLGRTLLLAAVFGMAAVAQAEEKPITTDSNGAAVEAVQEGSNNAAVSAASSEEAVMEYAYIAAAPSLVPAGMASPTIDIDINGYVNAGGMFNSHGTKYNMMSKNSDNQIGLDGAYIAAEKKAKHGCGLVDWGFGADAMFGRDARFMKSYAGLDSDAATGHTWTNYNENPFVWDLSDRERENYGFAAPQLYGEIAVNNTVFKMGHFYSLLGYESVRADERFFYSLGRSFEATPYTHTGALATYKGLRNLDLTVGWVMGEDNNFSRLYDESLITGGFKLNNGDQASLKYAFVAGKGAMGGQKGDLFRNDVVLTGKLSSRFETAFVFNCGSFKNGENVCDPIVTGGITDMLKYYGSDNMKYQTWGGYAFYTINSKWKVGSRTEWQRGTVNTGEKEGMECFEMGLGANWMPLASDVFVVRPEVRYDRAQGPAGTDGLFGNGLKTKDQVGLGFDVVCKF